MALPVPFYLDVTNPRKPALFVDGEDVIERYRVKRVGFEIGVEDLPKLFVELAAGGGIIEGEAIVHQVRDAEGENPRETILAFLRGVNPAVLEQAALERVGSLGGLAEDESVGGSFLGALRAMLGEG